MIPEKPPPTMLDIHPVFGGEAKQNQMLVDGVMLTGPQGSNGTVIPRADNAYAHVMKLLWVGRAPVTSGSDSRPYGRIAFGHSELSGRQSWGRAGQEAQRATKQILDVTSLS